MKKFYKLRLYDMQGDVDGVIIFLDCGPQGGGMDIVRRWCRATGRPPEINAKRSKCLISISNPALLLRILLVNWVQNSIIVINPYPENIERVFLFFK